MPAEGLQLCRGMLDGTTSCIPLEGNALMLAQSPDMTMGDGLSLVLLAYLLGISVAAIRRIFLGA